MKSKIFVFILFLGMALSACSGGENLGNENPGNPPEGEEHLEPGDLLEGTSWVLLHYRKTKVSEGIHISAVFENGSINGSSGCNSYSGTYQVEGSEITIGPLAGTMMACMDPAEVMEMEQMYLQWLMDAQSFKRSEERLMIFRSDGEALTFIPNP